MEQRKSPLNYTCFVLTEQVTDVIVNRLYFNQLKRPASDSTSRAGQLSRNLSVRSHIAKYVIKQWAGNPGMLTTITFDKYDCWCRIFYSCFGILDITILNIGKLKSSCRGIDAI